MKPSQKIALALAVLLPLMGCKSADRTDAPQKAVASPREADAETLALVAPLVKGGKLLNYTVTSIMIVKDKGVVVSLMKAGGFYPDGGETDGGPGCDPSQVDEAQLSLELMQAPKGGSSGGLLKGPYAIYARPRNVPQFEADRVAAALADLLSTRVDLPIPAALSGGPQLD